MISTYILDDDNNPVEEPDVHAWVAWLSENQHRRQTALTKITAEIHVSTIFLGGPTLEGKLWETMIRGGPDAYNIHRWSTHQEALEGHAKVVTAQKAKAACNTSKSESEDTGTTTGAS